MVYKRIMMPPNALMEAASSLPVVDEVSDVSSGSPGTNFFDRVGEVLRKKFNIGENDSMLNNYFSASSLPDQQDLYDENYLRTKSLMERQEEFQREMNSAAMNYNAEQARLAREWSTEMSNTAWQRAVKDMQLAGLNPALAYSQGPASTPGATSATGVTSAGASGSLSDTGYQYYNNVTDLAKSLISAAAQIISKKIPNVSYSESYSENYNWRK